MTVVVGVGDATGSRAAIEEAAQEARYRGARLVAVMAYHEDTALGAPAGRPVGTLETGADRQSAAADMLQQAVSGALGGEAGEVELRVAAGPPGRVLVDVAVSLDAGLIVLATRGDGTVARLLGTVNQFVLRNAPCPVLVVPETRRAEARRARAAAHQRPAGPAS
jgi:nucleotide-binding universal stress UspA family protein